MTLIPLRLSYYLAEVKVLDQQLFCRLAIDLARQVLDVKNLSR
jgi:hypothetical protein